MFESDPKALKIVAAKLRRILIIDPNPNAVYLLAAQMRQLGQVQIQAASAVEEALALVQATPPDLIFVEYASVGVDGLAFVTRLRRSRLACREAPVIMCTAEATAAVIVRARDAGVHEFLRKPFTLADLERRLAAVTLKPRDWIEAVQYVGPDRRRFNSAEYKGTRKRRSDPREGGNAARLSQALRIVKSAAQHLDVDPNQARRALVAQSADLGRLALALGDARLGQAAAALADCLIDETFDRAELGKRIAAIMCFALAEDLVA